MDTLLIIEDESLFRSELKRHYQRAGWHVILAPALRDAEHLLLRSRIAPLVVLSDMNLPVRRAANGNDTEAFGTT
jgi:DNA-binding response OmpR family regulator